MNESQRLQEQKEELLRDELINGADHEKEILAIDARLRYFQSRAATEQQINRETRETAQMEAEKAARAKAEAVKKAVAGRLISEGKTLESDMQSAIARFLALFCLAKDIPPLRIGKERFYQFIGGHVTLAHAQKQMDALRKELENAA